LKELVRRRHGLFTQQGAMWLSAVLFLLAATGLVFNVPGAQILTLLVIVAAMRAWRQAEDYEQFASRLMLAGFVSVLVAEIIVVNDAMTGRLERYNTVFKLYYPAWAHLTIAAVFFVWLQFRRLAGERQLPQRVALWMAVVALIALSLVYPYLATWARTDGFYSREGDPSRSLYAARTTEALRQRSLNGLAFLADETESPGDLAGILWLKQNVAGRPHILEAANQAYGYNGRVAAYTGLPTVIGWDNHELQWRGWELSPEVAARKADVARAYATTDEVEALGILLRYGIRYAFVGKLERALHPPEGLAKFDEMGERVFEKQGTIIYRMPTVAEVAP